MNTLDNLSAKTKSNSSDLRNTQLTEPKNTKFSRKSTSQS